MNPTPKFQALEASLAETYHRQQREYKRAVQDWTFRKFSALSSPLEELNFNPEMFFAKYFVTNGQPDKTKQEDGLLLHGIWKVDEEQFLPLIQYIPGLASHITTKFSVIGWEESLPATMDAAFATPASFNGGGSISLLVDEASFDCARFLNKHFLRKGIVKSKEAMELPCRPDFEDRLLKAIRTVPGLHCVVASPWERMFIGWDHLEVSKKIIACNEQRERDGAEEAALEEPQYQSDFMPFFQPHYEFLKTWKPSPGKLTLADLQGFFVTRCLEVSGYPCYDDELHLDIKP